MATIKNLLVLAALMLGFGLTSCGSVKADRFEIDPEPVRNPLRTGSESMPEPTEPTRNAEPATRNYRVVPQYRTLRPGTTWSP